MTRDQLLEMLEEYVAEIIYEENDTEDMMEYSYNPITNTIHIYPYAMRMDIEKLSLLRAFGGLLSKGRYRNKHAPENVQGEQVLTHISGAMEQLTAVLLSNMHSIELSDTEKLEMWNKLYLHMIGLSKTTWK